VHRPERVAQVTPEPGTHLLDELAELEAAEAHRRPWALLLLLLPLLAVVYPPLYDHDHPAFVGLPFFVWYQIIAVAFGGLVTGIVYLLRVGPHR
jgi:hypothetical protein